jgi:hypothetical protein
LQALYTPSKIDGGQVIAYENGLSAANSQMLSNFNSTLLELKPASDAGVFFNPIRPVSKPVWIAVTHPAG